ncbi:MAG TPA: hypothetical protein VJU78_05310 [Chitinophagaceae bacterium]|nr:hypothetical protein [Chitinophagaceae bacterium]
MKKIVILFVSGFALFLFASNDSKTGHSGHAEGNGPKTQADSLMKDVEDGHNDGMAKMGRLTRAEQATRRLMDSIDKLPAKARQAAAPLKAKLDSLQKDLSYAESAMNKWMNEFNMDSAVNNVQERIDYLQSEKLKVSNVKEAILSSLEKADSVLKEKL